MEFKIEGVSDLPDWLSSNAISFKVERDFVIQGDSADYDVLWNAAKSIKDVPGLILEIGVRLGKSSFVMVQACAENEDTDRKFIGVDCYGEWAPSYTNQMKLEAKATLGVFCALSGVDYTLFELEDTEYFKRYADGVPLYNRTVFDTAEKQYKPEDYEWKQVCNEYALVHLDGPHRMEDVVLESDFFMQRMAKNGVIVYDDIDKPQKYNHDEFEPTLFDNGFELIEKKGSKASYRKL